MVITASTRGDYLIPYGNNDRKSPLKLDKYNK